MHPGGFLVSNRGAHLRSTARRHLHHTKGRTSSQSLESLRSNERRSRGEEKCPRNSNRKMTIPSHDQVEANSQSTNRREVPRKRRRRTTQETRQSTLDPPPPFNKKRKKDQSSQNKTLARAHNQGREQPRRNKSQRIAGQKPKLITTIPDHSDPRMPQREACYGAHSSAKPFLPALFTREPAWPIPRWKLYQEHKTKLRAGRAGY